MILGTKLWSICALPPAIISTAATPSSSALCASMGPGIQSPMARIFATEVSSLSLTQRKPFLSRFTPSSSKPRLSVEGFLPTATNTTSQSIFCWLPPLTDSARRATPLSFRSTWITFVPSIKLMPCF